MSNDIKELIDRIKYYGTSYAIGDNLGREIGGTDDLLMAAASALENLDAQLEVCVKGGYQQNAGKRDIAIGPDQMGSRDANCDGF